MTDAIQQFQQLNDTIDARVAENFPQAGEAMPATDRLFDILMERFDVLNEARAGNLALIKEIDACPTLKLQAFLALQPSMQKTLQLAGIDAEGPVGRARTLGLTYVCVMGIKAWMDDEGADMPKTMAAVDKYIKRVDSLGELIGL